MTIRPPTVPTAVTKIVMPYALPITSGVEKISLYAAKSISLGRMEYPSLMIAEFDEIDPDTTIKKGVRQAIVKISRTTYAITLNTIRLGSRFPTRDACSIILVSALLIIAPHIFPDTNFL